MSTVASSRIRFKKKFEASQKEHNCIGGCGKKVKGWKFCNSCRARNRSSDLGCIEEERYEFHPEAIDLPGRRFYE